MVKIVELANKKVGSMVKYVHVMDLQWSDMKFKFFFQMGLRLMAIHSIQRQKKNNSKVGKKIYTFLYRATDPAQLPKIKYNFFQRNVETSTLTLR